jgi:hypothetical protein
MGLWAEHTWVRNATISAAEKMRSDVVWFCMSFPLRCVWSSRPEPLLYAILGSSVARSAGPRGQWVSKLLEKDHCPMGLPSTLKSKAQLEGGAVGATGRSGSGRLG